MADLHLSGDDDAAAESDAASTHSSFHTSLPTPQTTGTATPRKEGDDTPAGTQPEPSYNFSKLASNPEWSTLVMTMLPCPGGSEFDLARAAWIATLEVRCADLARLMERGFFWGAENVVPGDVGGPPADASAWWAARGFCHARRWALAAETPAVGGGGVPSWVATLDVISRFAELPPRFPLHALSWRQVRSAGAWEAGSDRKVYQFDYRAPWKNFNLIFDDKPLQGWWPWPREAWWWPWRTRGWWSWQREDEDGDDAGSERSEGGEGGVLDRFSPSSAVTGLAVVSLILNIIQYLLGSSCR